MKEIFEEIKRRHQVEMERYNRNLNKNKVLDKDFVHSTIFPPITLEEKDCGEYEITKTIEKAGEKIVVVSVRNYLLMGYKPINIILDIDRPIHHLVKKGEGLLMSDSPQEMFLQYEMYKKAKGKVLVGGLGLGMYARMIEQKEDVTEIVVVEINQDIINLSTPKDSKKIRIIKDDITHFLKTTNEKFDYIYIDTYYSTGVSEYLNIVLPMRKILTKRFPSTPTDFWAEEEVNNSYQNFVFGMGFRQRSLCLPD